jgi:hypothetical protein
MWIFGERMMDFLRKLFGGAASGGQNDRGVYFYVQPKGCDEVVRVRVDPHNDLSANEEESGYWVRKQVRGTSYKCMAVELTLYFDERRSLQNQEVKGGALVTEKDYQGWLEKNHSA